MRKTPPRPNPPRRTEEVWRWAKRQSEPFDLDRAHPKVGLSKSGLYSCMHVLLRHGLAERKPLDPERGEGPGKVYLWRAIGKEEDLKKIYPMQQKTGIHTDLPVGLLTPTIWHAAALCARA